MNTITDKAAVAKNVFAEAATNMLNIVNVNAEKLSTAQNDDEKREFEASRKHAETHHKFNAALSDMSEKALASLSKYNVDAQHLSEQSRELKKRSIAILESVSNNKRVDDTALDAMLQRLAAKKDATMTLAQIQREMNHKTTTQAQYFKTCAQFFNFAQYSKSDKALTFNYDSKVLKDLLKQYASA